MEEPGQRPVKVAAEPIAAGTAGPASSLIHGAIQFMEECAGAPSGHCIRVRAIAAATPSAEERLMDCPKKILSDVRLTMRCTGAQV